MARSLLLTLLTGLLVATGCASSREPTQVPRLPFSVALMPVAITQLREPSIENASRTKMTIDLDQDAILDRVERILEERCFARILRLRPSPEVQEKLADGVNPRVFSEEWVEKAEAEGADLLIQLSVSYSPDVYIRRSDLFWLSLVSFQFAGQFSYWINDTSYHAPAELDVGVHDVLTMAARRASIEDQRAEILDTKVIFEKVDLDFIDRNEHWAKYLLSLIFPVALMSRETEKAKKRVKDELSSILAEQLADRILRKRDQILLAEDIANFTIDEAEFELLHDSLRVSIDLLLEQGARLEELDRYELIVGEEKALEYFEGPIYEPGDGEKGEGNRLRYSIRKTLFVESDVRYLRLKVWDTEQNARSFTFRVRESKRK